LELLHEARRIAPRYGEIRRRIHRHPEPAYEEVKTAGLVAETLQGLGIPAGTGIAKTGVMGRIDGRAPGRCVLLRADMDALRKEEAVSETERPHRSKVPGVMHACGHDGHVAVLLGAAELLKSRAERFEGTVKLVFQPAEEGGRGGLRMVEEGVLEDPKVGAAFALHAWPELPCGVAGFQYGTLMAASADFVVEILGRSGHAAFPHQCVDPVPAAAQLVSALQTIRSREVGPLEGSVVSVTVLETGSKTVPGSGPGEDALRPSQTNIIPQLVRLRGTSRSLSLEGQEHQLKRIREIAEAVASAHGARATFAIGKDYPPTTNDRAMTDLARGAALVALGEENVVWLEEPTMGGEDFSYFLQRVPGSFIHLGTARGDTPEALREEPALHADRFDFNDDALPAGMALMASIALAFLESPRG